MKERWIVIALLAIALVASVVSASPMDFTVQEIDGKTCVISDNDIECWCKGECGPALECERSTPVETPDPVPSPDPKPTPVPTPPPTDEPDKEKCNRGLGNASEGCDPGNSGGKPGSAGEDNE